MSIKETMHLTIDEKAYGYAKIYASLLSDEFQRKRAYASILALYSFLNTIEKEPYQVQKSMTLFRNPLINEQYEISDLYVNGWHLDIRVVTSGDAVLIPKIHYDADIVPDFYVVVRVDSVLKNAELIGIADTANVTKEPFDYHYYSIAFDKLISYEEFLNKIQNKKLVTLKQEDHELFKESYLGLMDNELDNETKNKILKHLFQCDECRTEFCCFTGFEMVSCNAGKYPELLEDKTLNIIGAQCVDDKKYEGKEETVCINDDINNENPLESDETKEETVSDILDELFNIEEDFIEDSEAVKEKSIITEEVYPSSTIDNEIQIIEDESNEDEKISKQNEELEIIEDTSFVDLQSGDVLNKDEIEVIQENITSELSLKSDVEVLGENTTDVLDEKDELVILDEPENIDLITDENGQSFSEEVDTKQKVIVDYDETGNPVYSYITPVNQDESEDILSEIEPIDDEEVLGATDDIEYDLISDEENEQIDNYPNEESDEMSADIDSSKYENNLDTNDEFSEDYEEVNNEDLLDDSTGAVSKYEDYEDESSEEIQEYEEYKDDDSEVNQEYDEYKDDDSEVNQEYDEYKDDDFENNQEYDEYQDDETDETQEYEEYADDDGEYDDEDVEIPEEKISKGSSKVALLLISVVVLLSLIGGGVFFLLKNKSNTEVASSDTQSDSNAIEVQKTQVQNDMFEQPIDSESENVQSANTVALEDVVNSQNSIDANVVETIPSTGTIAVPPLTESDLIKPVERKSHGDVNKAIANAFSQGGNGVSLRGLNWFCTSELFSDRTFKNYLQNLDNTLKQNLKNNILNATQTPPKDSVSAKFAIDNNGNLQKVIISESSGLEEIDNIVLQSIKESFEGEKSMILNNSELKADMYYLKVVIKL